MKKITFLAAALFAFGAVNAQTTLFEDDFESYSAAPNTGDGNEVPTGYLSYDVNSNGYHWGLSNPSDWTQPIGDIYSGNFMISVSYHSGPNVAVEADAILVLPMISIPGDAEDVELTFFAGSGTDENFFSETYDVIVSSASDEASVLAGDVVFSETLPFQGGEEKGPISLDAYVGQDIYISFYHRDTNDEWVLGVDDIAVKTSNSVGVVENNVNGFSQFYSAQSKNLTISADNAFSNIALYNVVGQQVLNKALSSNNEVINLANLKDGVYIATATADGNTTTFKIVKR